MFILLIKIYFVFGKVKGRYILYRFKSFKYCLDENFIRLNVSRINKKNFNGLYFSWCLVLV